MNTEVKDLTALRTPQHMSDDRCALAEERLAPQAAIGAGR